jgi:hypothetical protein
LVVGVCSVAALAPSFAAQVSFPADGVLVYSSLCQGEEDAGGDKVVLIRGAEGVTAVYWRTEGAILAPLLAFGPDAVKVDERAGSISLRFVDSELGPKAGTYTLDGTITDDELTVSSNVAGALRMPRVRVLDAHLPKCHV